MHARRRNALLTGLLLTAAVSIPDTAGAAPLGDPPIPDLSSRLLAAPAPFIANEGQIDEDVSFYARTFAGTFFVTTDGDLVYALPGTSHREATARWVLRESFAGSGPAAVRGAEPSPVRIGEYLGSDPGSWKSRLATFEAVELGELYPGIRVSLQALGNNVEKLFLVLPGADATAIDILVEGAQGPKVDASGRLILGTDLGDVVFTAPIAYQTFGEHRRPVEVAYEPREGGRYGFRVGPYDASRALVIDPLLEATYLGGHNPNPPGNYDDDFIHGVAVTEAGVYVAGATQSPDFPVRLGYDDTLDSSYPDGFVTLMSADLSTVIASTYLGTPGFDRVQDVTVDAGGVVVVGQAGQGFPVTPGAYTWSGTTPVGGGFVARLSTDLSALLASSVPTPSDYPRTAALGNGGIYFAGTTTNRSFPITPGAWKSTCCPGGPFGIPEADGFAGKLSSDLSTLEAMTYLGGDAPTNLDVGPDGALFVTDGFDYAVTGYIARFDPLLTDREAYLSFYGSSTSGSTRTYFHDVAVANGYVVMAGQTFMDDLPATPGAFDTTCGTDGICNGEGALQVPHPDGFVAIYDYDLEDVVALTYFGGSHDESIRAISLDVDGSIYLVGETTSIDFPTAGEGIDDGCGTDGLCDPTGPYDTPTPDGFVARLSPDLSSLEFGSYLGGSGEDRPLTVIRGPGGTFYAAGYTRSVDFPATPGAFDETYNGGTSDAFVAHFESGADAGLIFWSDFEIGTTLEWAGREPGL